MSGSTGCNRFSGSVVLAGESLKLGPLMTTRRGCAGAAMDEEKRFLRSLEACRSWRRAQDQLELRDDAGAVLLRLDAAASSGH